MFSDSGSPAPGEQKGFKPHTPHFIPWLRNSLKPHQNSDLGLNRQLKPSSETRNNLTPLERAKGIGFFSIQGKDRAKKGELRCNGVGMARMLPVVLRGHHILPASLGKQREDSPARWNQTKELDTDPNTQSSPGDGLQGLGNSSPSTDQDNHNFVRNHSSRLGLRQSQSDGTSVRKYGPLVGPPPTPVLAEESNCKEPVVVCMEDKRGKVWDYSSQTTCRQRDLHSSSWLGSDTQGLIERQHGFSSSFSYVNKHSRNSQSQRDLTALREPPVEGFNGPLNGLIFSTELPHRSLGCSTTLRGPRKPRPSSECITIQGQNQTWVQRRPNSEGQRQRKQASCSRKVVRNQIKRVVDNLEQVLKALRDVQQEMKEVVQQIDYLTSSIDLNEEEQQEAGGDSAKPPSDSSYSSGSSSSEATVGSTYRRPSESWPGTVDSCDTHKRDHPNRSQSPPNVQLCPITSGFLSERSRTLRITCRLGSSSRQGGLQPVTNNAITSNLHNLTSDIHSLSPQRHLPVRPPTPGLSPLTVNLHHPSSPTSQPHSPVAPSSPLSPKPPPALSPSVNVKTKVGSYRTPQSFLPSAGPLFPSSTLPPSASCPPTDSETQTSTDRERRASSAGHAATARLPTTQGRRGRKPPPYPHHRLTEHTKKVKEPRKVPPYPEKRRLLSTTV
ncbi:uncharacterized protein LOC114434092 isoform X2 [Parambassis ranga]|uniref:Uncharacterized protein LOC114434092 isoform X2 n=1 Tax=Parambassis ranga TaxID=210632 RepID=A0A6P7I2L1_9TELE|nr:uncharacterized protein LOC114434092 isoform X2 [Parambassis ranga]